MLSVVGIVLEFFLAIAVLSGITVIVVEFKAICETIFSLSAGYWFLIGFLITFTHMVAVLVIFYSSIIGISQ